ncbi:MAG: ATP-dependent RecD-like DNA helicase [Lachnospiraceae bacterium]|nr:ATP-dependent RecD-like DNA helicase [Lachnospiraceae bacterium]
METKQVYVEDVIFKAEDDCYYVLETIEGSKILTVVGQFHENVTGQTLKITGEMTMHKRYGMQFKVTAYEIVEPTDKEDIYRYLSSGAIKGIGTKLAQRIVDMFGDDTLKIMEEQPERLAEVKGISLRAAQELGIQIEEKKELRNAHLLLQEYGFSLKMINRIWEHYQNSLFNVIKENPYKLAEDIDGIGFRRADAIAMARGIEKRSEYRVRAGLLYLLTENLAEGHTALPAERLVSLAMEILQVDEEIIRTQVSNLVVAGSIIMQDDLAFHYRAYYAEKHVAQMLRKHNWTSEDDAAEVASLAKKAWEGQEYTPDPLQLEAVTKSAGHGIFLLTGGPGTGKTTTLNAIIRFFLQQKKKLVLAAPTGRAAKRMSEATGYQAKTIHRLLEVKSAGDGARAQFEKNEDDPLDADVIIVDEMSMVDIFLFEALLCAVPIGANLILVGDPDQLPSVGPGQVLYDLLDSDAFCVGRLQTIFRQAEESGIVTAACHVRDGEMVDVHNTNHDFVFLSRDDATIVRRDILTLVLKQLPKHFQTTPSEIQVLTPVKKGLLGVGSLNELLQEYSNPKDKGKPEYRIGDKVLRLDDKVMQMKNDYDMVWKIRGVHGIVVEQGQGVYNGDLGKVTRINEQERIIEVEFDDGRLAEYDHDSMENLELAYAMTIHKSQGSEYPAVVIPLLTVPNVMLYRNLFYTAITRAAKCVVILGEEKVIAAMIAGEDKEKRYTGLKERIIEQMAI